MTDRPSNPSWQPTNVASLLANHANDPHTALTALVARYNHLVHSHAVLTVEKDAAVKAAERSALENQQLWRSFKSSGGSPRPPGSRQNSSGGAGTGVPLRRGMSNQDSSSTISSLGIGRELATAPEYGRSQDTSSNSSTSTARPKATMPPPVLDPSIQLDRDGRQTALRKAASLDLGRRAGDANDGTSGDAVAAPRSPPASTRSYSDQSSSNTSGFPTSASMPVMPSPDSSDRPSHGNGRSTNRRFIPSIIPVSPLQMNPHQSDSASSSPRGESSARMYSSSNATEPDQLQLPGSTDARRTRTPSTTSASSMGSGSGGSASAVVEERQGVSKLGPVVEAEPSGRHEFSTPPAPPVSSPPPFLDPGPPYRAHDDSQSTPRSNPDVPSHSHPPQNSSFLDLGANSDSGKPPRRRTPSAPGQHPPPSTAAAATPPPPPRPTLFPAFFPFTRVRVPSSNIKPNDKKGKEVVSFLVDIIVTVPPESDPDQVGGTAKWRIEKLYSDILELDSAVKTKLNKAEIKKLGQLPDKSLFKDHAPHKSDQRKTILERYLQSMLLVPFRDKTAICAFFNCDIVIEPPPPSTASGEMEGWLTKRGRNFGGWQMRYYTLANGTLSYAETRDGPKLGEIPLHNAAIGRQSSRAAESGDDSYIHAFLVRTTTRGAGDKELDADHILCAESDEARDAWVTALTSLQSGAQQQTTTRTNGSASFDREREREAAGKPEHRKGSASVSSTGPEGSVPPVAAPRRTPSADLPPSMSLPAGLDSMARGDSGKRSASAQDHYPDQRANQLLPPTASGQRSASGPVSSVSVGVGSNGNGKSSHHHHQHHSDRPVSPDNRRGGDKIVTSQVSGPMNASPMPSGYDFKKADRSKKTKSSFWNFSRSTGPGNEKAPGVLAPAVAPRPVFGVPLKEAVAVSRIRPGLELPAVVYRCVEYLEAKNAESEEGIFRLSGSANVIRVLKDRFNAEGDVQLLSSAEYYDPHAIAGLLKSFLRELPVHILTRELHPEFIQVIELRERKDRVNALGKLIARLPIEEYTLFRFFFAHLCVIAQNAEVSKMTLRNLGIVFSPTLGIPAPLFSLLLSEFDLVFAVDTTGVSRPIMVEDDAVPEARAEGLGISPTDKQANRNSVLYEATGAPQLMEREGRRTKLREQVDEDSDAESDTIYEEEPPIYEEEPPVEPPSTFLTLPNSHQLHSSPPASSNSSPRTPSIRGGLPPSPRPGATFENTSARVAG